MTSVPRTNRRVALNRWPARLGELATYAGWGLASYVSAMMLWVAIPALAFGWQPLVVVSGSMAPLIRSGDLVLVDDQRTGLGAGTVIAFRSARDDVVLHRVVGTGPDGSLRTKGDSNQDPDSAGVHVFDVIGTGRLLVPGVGLPRIWGVGWMFAIAGLLGGAGLAWRRRRSWAIAIIAVGISMTGAAFASASFTDATANSGSTLSAIEVAAASGLSATCGAAGASNVNVDLTWTASISSGITSYEILHDAPGGGSSFSVVGTVNGSETAFTHSVAVALFGLGTHTYAVRALVGSWTSVESNTDAVSIFQLVSVYACSTL